MSSKPELRIDWATHEAARYACENWHYSRSVPVGKTVRFGVWEGKEYRGCILYSWGANNNLAAPYGLVMTEACELVRVALKAHIWPVSRMLAVTFRMLRQQSPGLRLIVSFADPVADHHGGIYQAGGWIYSGTSSPSYELRLNGARLQKRAYTGANYGKPKSSIPAGAVKVATPGKHRYLMPLDPAMREKIAPLAKPYPKRAKEQDAGHHPALGGATPTRTLHTSGKAATLEATGEAFPG